MNQKSKIKAIIINNKSRQCMAISVKRYIIGNE
jgi:hypothetical protein